LFGSAVVSFSPFGLLFKISVSMDRSFINRTLAKYDREYYEYTLGGFYARLIVDQDGYKGPIFIY